MRPILVLVVLCHAAVLCACGGGSSDDLAGPPGSEAVRTKEDREKWEKEVQAKFSEANVAIDRTKRLLASVKTKGNAELLDSLTQAQAAIQDVSQKQKNLNGLFALALGALEEFSKQNQQLAIEKKTLEAKKTDLEARERLFSMGFYTSLGAAVLAVMALLVKLPTTFLDRRYRKLEILQKRIEVRKLRREVTEKGSPA
jgi:hypothetical protein